MQDQWGNAIDQDTTQDGTQWVFTRGGDGVVVAFPASLSQTDAQTQALSVFNGMQPG